MIDSPHTRKEKREKIVALCENAQDIMKDILEKHKNNEVMLVLYFFNSSVCEVVLSTFGNSTTFFSGPHVVTVCPFRHLHSMDTCVIVDSYLVLEKIEFSSRLAMPTSEMCNSCICYA